MTSPYLFKIPGNSAIEISHDELRSLLGEIEGELHRSRVYRQAVAKLQKLLGSCEEAKTLFKAVGREAIGLAFQQFAHHAQVLDTNQQTDTAAETSNNQINPQTTNTDLSSKPSPTQDVTNTCINNPENSENKHPVTALVNWLKPNQKTAKAELAKQMAEEQRLETMRQIGQQLKQAREARGFSFRDLAIFTHLPIHQMEAVESGNLDLLPEDILVRGFIRVMGNALGLNGIVLANSLPATNIVPSVLPSWSKPKHSKGLEIEIRPMHLYLGYTALVAGTVGSLSLMSQPGKIDTTVNPEVTPSSPISQSSQDTEMTAKPGIKSSPNGIGVGSDIAPPEAL
ncbi:helix-turn-helix transcriptional regulator [Nostoc sp. FACHB-152]|nr:helix-turn-helix transcriptional regulator [Nostoc sp. FACHB-152]